MFDFNLNGKLASENGVYVIRRPDIPTRKRRTELITVPGMDGAFVKDSENYEPIAFSIECNFMSSSPDTFWKECEKIRCWLFSQQQSFLTFNDSEEIGYKTLTIQPSDITRTSKRIGVFTIDINCQPFPYFVSGQSQITVADNDVLTWPGKRYYQSTPTSFPIYELNGAGEWKIEVNGLQIFYYSFEMSLEEDKATIDTEKQLIFNQYGHDIGTAINRGDISDLVFGKRNKINISAPSGGILKITPNWRTF